MTLAEFAAHVNTEIRGSLSVEITHYPAHAVSSAILRARVFRQRRTSDCEIEFIRKDKERFPAEIICGSGGSPDAAIADMISAMLGYDTLKINDGRKKYRIPIPQDLCA